LAFGEVGLDYRDHVVQDEQFYRPAEVESLIGDATRARTVLKWQPEYTFPALVKDMITHDVQMMSDRNAAKSQTASEAN
jgi:GDPmannose 4,6-dehydratase